MADSTARAGMKRPHSDSVSQTKRKVRRKLHHIQYRPQKTEPAPQDHSLVDQQMLQSISAALVTVGFDSVLPTALEMFRSHAEEFMLNFLHDVRESTFTSRRRTPTAQDFAFALANSPNTSSASLLIPQVKHQLPESVSCPIIPDPDKAEDAPPDFSALLEPLVNASTPSYIPKHFPKLPPKHAWVYTDDFPAREQDARQMREKATEEGILAEQALRKLAAAAKTGAAKAEKRRLNTLSGEGRRLQDREASDKRMRKDRYGSDAGEELFGDMMKDVAGAIDADERQVMDLGMQGVHDLKEQGIDVGMPDGLVVNSQMGSWRRGGRKGVRV